MIRLGICAAKIMRRDYSTGSRIGMLGVMQMCRGTLRLTGKLEARLLKKGTNTPHAH